MDVPCLRPSLVGRVGYRVMGHHYGRLGLQRLPNGLSSSHLLANYVTPHYGWACLVSVLRWLAVWVILTSCMTLNCVVHMTFCDLIAEQLVSIPGFCTRWSWVRIPPGVRILIKYQGYPPPLENQGSGRLSKLGTPFRV
jgi:hypothetical protein